MSDFKPSAALVAAQTRTLERIEAIAAQFNTPGSGRFAGKVAILTGVGSLKGIGRATAVLLAREGASPCPTCRADRTGAKHLYVVDYDAEHLPALKEELERRFAGLVVRRRARATRLTRAGDRHRGGCRGRAGHRSSVRPRDC